MSITYRSLTVGLATYSLKDAPVDTVIAVLRSCGIGSVSVNNAHVPILTGTPAECFLAAKKFKDAGITLASTGVVELGSDPTGMRRLFENARAAGVPAMACTFPLAPDRAALDLAGAMAREYDIRLAIHNHGPEDPLFPTPREIWRVIRDCDVHVGFCLDVGHAYRAGANPVEAVGECGSRLYDVHFNDTASAIGMCNNRAVGLGLGKLDLPGILAALLERNYSYQVGLEDEVSGRDPISGVANSLGYIRGLLAAQLAARDNHASTAIRS